MEQFASLGEPHTMDKKLRPEDYSSYKIQGLVWHNMAFTIGESGSLIVTSTLSALIKKYAF